MQEKFLIVGLGNPGSAYQATWHNIGFAVVDQLATLMQTTFSKHKKLYGDLAQGHVQEDLCYLLKPTTFMNLSGKAVKATKDFYKVSLLRTLVILDDFDLPLGEIRLKEKGSAGGHNGLKSIIEHLGTNQFPRLRVGIKGFEQQRESLESYVLRKWPPTIEKKMQTIFAEAGKASLLWIEKGGLATMNQINKKIQIDPKDKTE